MLISFPARLCYLAGPKTGSTAIEDQLRPVSSVVLQGTAHAKHLNVREYRALLGPLLQHINVPPPDLCAVMRHPMDWIRSWYRYRQRDGESPGMSTRDIDFETFVDGFLADEKPVFTHYIGTQYDFLRDEDGEVRVDHLFRYDDIDAFYRFLGERFQRPFEFRQMNVSPRVDVVISVDAQMRLERAFARDYELYHRLT
ncbi:hypothetical protein GE300_13595 [Rhodobacteraceae bacterium 2CG4]|uniref:Sulfotransferase family protein n=1 Tax=Halovulum marinum TaxID=2662447 RepID=A0A6L5Z3I3_9RHOB|nr:hypothetical protein [Halovulum marinum]MSU90635.1 hypothetical protein [Halovulum marinum]